MYEYILPEHIWGKFQDDYKGAKQETGFPSVGTGPFIITNYVKNQYVQLDRNPNYWGNDVGLHAARRPDHLPDLRQPGRRGRRPAVRRGRLRLLHVGEHPEHAEVPRPRDARRGRPQLRRDRHQHRLGLPDRPDRWVQAARRRRIRRSRTWCSDKPCEERSTTRRWSTRSCSATARRASRRSSPTRPPGHWEPGPDDPDLSFNIDAANQMLDDAGYTMGPDGVRIDPKSGKPLEFRFFSRTSDQNSIDIVPYCQGLDAADRHQARSPDAQQQQAGQRDPGGRLRPVRMGLVPEPRPELHPEHLHVRAASAGRQHLPQLRQLLLQPGVRQALQAAGLGDERQRAARHRPPDAGDPLPGPAVHRAVERRVAGGVQPELDGLHAATRSERGRARRVRPALVHQHPARERNARRVEAAHRAASRPASGSASSSRSSSSSAVR